jgi:amino acid transporter/nucleotide-binding universal stress UspA family protein
MIATDTKRPRNVDWTRAAAILYGDWGTSKAYVIGLAFAVAGYSSFWLLAPMCVLTALVGINYMVICRHYPEGGGVYASVRHRSEVISIVGAFLLIADYIVTAAISALSAFQYLSHAVPAFPHSDLATAIMAAIAIGVIGALNIFGPKHTGGLAFLVSLPTAIVVVVLGSFCLPHVGEAVHSLRPIEGGFLKNWSGFVGIVLALSGVEAIANATGVMKLDPGSTPEKPSVSKTSTPAIIVVMIEVCVFTALLGLAMHALGDLTTTKEGDVNAPGAAGVRDYMLGYMAQIFVGGSLGAAAGTIASVIVSIVFAFLLLSAVNTAIVDLIAISFLMSRDGELPPLFQTLNKYGVPNVGILVATVVPMALVIFVKDMAGLADLYAVGVVGAIATNLGASSTDKHLGLIRRERVLMFCTFLVMLGIEVSLFIDKPNARVFAVTVLAVGLIFRGLAAEHQQRKKRAAAAAAAAPPPLPAKPAPALFDYSSSTATGAPLLCAVRGIGRTLDFAIEEAKETNRPLYLLFIREQPAMTSADRKRKWQDDPEAYEIFAYAADKADGHTVIPCYAVSDTPADTIVDVAATVGASRLILGAPQRGSVVNLLRGNMVRKVADVLPEDIHLLVYA